MAFILTFLGTGDAERSTAAIAAARRLARDGSRVLLVARDPSPGFGLLLGAEVPDDPQEIDANFHVVRLCAPTLLERSWGLVKDLEAQYLRTPVLQQVYGQELSVLPGMDDALTLDALREFNASGDYDAIVYDGTGDVAMLRMFALPETLSWYARRSRQLFANSDIGKAIAPFVQPISSAVLNVTWTAEDVASQNVGPAREANQLLDEGVAAVADPKRVAAFLVSSESDYALTTAKFYWGCAQQAGLTVGGLLLTGQSEAATTEFAPLSVTAMPGDVETAIAALPDLRSQAERAPRPVEVSVSDRQVKLFLPGFGKKQVKLTQYGPELTVEAGDLRRNLALPPQLSGRSVSGAKFQDGYLIVSL